MLFFQCPSSRAVQFKGIPQIKETIHEEANPKSTFFFFGMLSLCIYIHSKFFGGPSETMMRDNGHRGACEAT